MLERAELTRVVADVGLAERLIASAKRHLTSAEQLSDEDPELAYAAIHDAVRKGDGGDASGTRIAAHDSWRSSRCSACCPGPVRVLYGKALAAR
jgi:hypothetical protein